MRALSFIAKMRIWSLLKALHHLAGHRLVSIQEAVNMADDQPLVICTDSMAYANISQGKVLRDDLKTDKRKYIITVY
jgi:hypothetical protein